MNLIYLSLIKNPDVIISETSNGTKYAIAMSTELHAIENKKPKEPNCVKLELIFTKANVNCSIFIPQAVAMFITIIITMTVIRKAYTVGLKPAKK